MIGWIVTFVVLATAPTVDRLVSTTSVDNQMYAAETPTDRCESLLLVRPALMIGANDLLNDTEVGPSTRVPSVGE